MSELPENEIQSVEMSGMVYALAASAEKIFAACSGSLLSSSDGGDTWQDALAALQLSGEVPITSLALSPDFDRTGHIFAGAPGGIFRSSDHGQTWKAVLFPPPAPTVSALAMSPNYAADETAFAGTMEDGVFLTTNGGERWIAWNFGLLDLNVMSLGISPNFAADETLFAGTETGIFRSTNGGRAWREVELPFGFDAVLSLALSPHFAQDHTLYAGTESNGLWISKDEGETWARLGADQIEDPVNSIMLAEGRMLAATSSALWVSSDGGETWEDQMPISETEASEVEGAEEDEEREYSAMLLPKGLFPGAPVIAGLADGGVEFFELA